MATYKHLRSSTANKRPTTSIADGQLAINSNAASAGLFFKDSTGATIIKVGPVHVGTTAPNATPGAGGSSGNSTGEVWLDTSLTPVGVKIWNGSAWVNGTPIGSTTVQGLLELATDVETQAGSDTARAVTPSSLQSKVSDSTSTTSSTTIASSTAVKSAFDLANAALPKSGGTVTGNLEIGTTGSLTFEGSVADGFETTIAVTNPTADRTITLPDQTGNMLVSGNASIVNADVNASAAIAGTKISPDFGSQTVQTTGIFSHALGSAAAPTITFTGDPNTGIYSPGADQVAISTNGTGRLFVDAGGTVNIGTSAGSTVGTFPRPCFYIKQFTDPASGFGGVHIEAAGEQSVLGIGYDGTAQVFAFDTSYRGTGAFRPIAFKTSNTERLRITSAGLVGVGTSSPSYLLHVNGNGAEIGLTDTAVANATWRLLASTGGSTKLFRIYDSSNAADRFVIDSSGRVGIGTSAPDAKLEVVDTASSLTYPIAVSNFTDPATDVGSAIDFRLTTGGNSRGYIACRYTSNSSSDGTYLSFAPNDGSTGNVERMRITKAGNVGIGSTTPQAPLDVTGTGNGGVLSDGAIRAYSANRTAYSTIAYNGIDASTNSGGLLFSINQSEAARIDSSKRLLVGTSTSFGSGLFQVSSSASLGSYFASAFSNAFYFVKSRSATTGQFTVVQNGDELGQFLFQGTDGSANVTAASILAAVDGTPGTNDMPGRLVFSTTADGASSPTERMRITSGGDILFVKTTANDSASGVRIARGAFDNPYTSFARSAAAALYVNRTSDDGTLVEFAQDGTTEGTISVSGTTVSYNGAHLSRWSQLPGGAERIEILRGSVLSNIDEMCDWPNEENEQLNRMKVSDVEGDKNVSGVFQAWDDDDDTYTNDFYCAMTGDFIIRIAQGVTVERGDLLMSAGDGTAKPQDDDIIRSKTIAKVTSTNVSCTYDDGSYCVPCVLMAC